MGDGENEGTEKGDEGPGGKVQWDENLYYRSLFQDQSYRPLDVDQSVSVDEPKLIRLLRYFPYNDTCLTMTLQEHQSDEIWFHLDTDDPPNQWT